MTVDELRVINVSHENITESEATSNAPPSTWKPDLTTRNEVDVPVTIAAVHGCSVCHEEFESKSGLDQHIRNKHPCLANERCIQAAKANNERKRAACTSSKTIAASNSAG